MKTTKILLVIVCLIFPLNPTTAQSGNDDWVLKTTLTKPSARDNHAMAYIENGKVVLYGGNTGAKSSETWVYTISTNSWELKSPVTDPGVRMSHAIAYLGGDQVLMFGGSDVNYPRTSSCWIYDLSDNNWWDINPPTRPGSRRQHAMAYIGDGKVLMVGGEINTGEGDSWTTWLYDSSDPNRWSEKADFISNVKWHSMSYIGGDQVLLSGGYDGGRKDWNYVYDLSENTWTGKTGIPLWDQQSDMVYLGSQKTMLFGVLM